MIKNNIYKYTEAVKFFKSIDQSSPLQYQAKLNRHYNETKGEKEQRMVDGMKKIVEIASNRIPYVGPAVSEAVGAANINVKKKEHADQIGIKVVKEGNQSPTINFSNESTW